MDSIWYCEKTDMFSLLCPHKLKRFRHHHPYIHYKKKDFIYNENDNASQIYLVAKGKVRIGYYKNDGSLVTKAILSKGEVFGEKAFLGIEKRNEFAQSIDAYTKICAVNTETMHCLLRENKAFSITFYKFLGTRFKKLERRLELLLFKDAKTRLLEFLKELKDDYGHYCPNTGLLIIKHPYTQKDIANLIATSRPTLNIMMNELKGNQIIHFSRNQIIFKN